MSAHVLLNLENELGKTGEKCVSRGNATLTDSEAYLVGFFFRH